MFATEHGFKKTPPRMAAEKPGSPEIFQRPGMGQEAAVTTVPGETGSKSNFQVFFCRGKTERFFFSKLSSVQEEEDINV